MMRPDTKTIEAILEETEKAFTSPLIPEEVKEQEMLAVKYELYIHGVTYLLKEDEVSFAKECYEKSKVNMLENLQIFKEQGR